MTVRFERQALTFLNDEWIDTFHICKKNVFYLECDFIFSVVGWRYWRHFHSGILQVGVQRVLREEK